MGNRTFEYTLKDVEELLICLNDAVAGQEIGRNIRGKHLWGGEDVRWSEQLADEMNRHRRTMCNPPTGS
jgi:hypothetical protein